MKKFKLRKDKKPEYVAWSTRKMPLSLRSRLNAMSSVTGVSIQELANFALEAGLEKLELDLKNRDSDLDFIYKEKLGSGDKKKVTIIEI